MSNEKNAALTVYAQNRYVYNTDDIAMLKVIASAGNGPVNTFKKGQRIDSDSQTIFAKKAELALGFKNEGESISAGYPEITVNRTGGTIQLTFGDMAMSTMAKRDPLGLEKIAAPTKMTFRPHAVKYEISKDDFAKLGNALQTMYTPNSIYRVVNNTGRGYELGDITNDYLYSMMNCTPLRDGSATVKEKAISLYKLDNGFGIKLGKSTMIVVTLAEPLYKNNESVCVRYMSPETNSWSTFPTHIKQSTGYDANTKDFMYEVCDVNGNNICVPERQVFESAVAAQNASQDENENGVKLSHF